MPYWIDKRIVELQIPKTGSSWRVNQYQHLGIEAETKGPRHSPEWKEWIRYPATDVVTFVRHPLTWLASRFSQGGVEDELQEMAEYFSGTEPFADFVDCYLRHKPGAVGRIMSEYTENATMVYRFENLYADFRKLCVKVTSPINLDRIREDEIVGPSPINRYRDVEQMASVCNAEADHISRWYGMGWSE